MKLIKYKKFLACLCAFIILFVFLIVPVSASSTFIDGSDSQPYFTPGDIAFTFRIDSYSEPREYYVSHHIDPILGNYFDLPYRNDSLYDHIENTDQTDYVFYANFISEFIDYNASRSNIMITEDGFPSGLASFNYHFDLEFNPEYYNSNYYLSSINISDFYCWNNDDLYDFRSETNLFIRDLDDFVNIDHITVVYRDVGTSELLTTSLLPENVPRFLTGEFELTPRMIDGNSRSDAVYYVDSLVIDLSYISYRESFSGYMNYIYYPGLEVYDLNQFDPSFDDNPAFSLAPYTTWIANAVGGFMDFEIYHDFTIGGIFMTIIAFACCVWFLKLVAGG